MSSKTLYEIQGDASAALELCNSKNDFSSPTQQYNRMILSFLVEPSRTSNSSDLLTQMERWTEESNRETETDISGARKERKKIIVEYNRSLVLCTSGRAKDALGPLLERLRPIVVARQLIANDLVEPYARLGLLLLECILVMSEGNPDGLREIDDDLTTFRIIRWMESLDFELHQQLKFLLCIYKSRLDFASRDATGKLIDLKVRSVKKELRSAMEILNRKLRPAAVENAIAGGETASVGSSSDVYPEENPVTTLTSGSSSVPHTPGAGNRQEGLVQRHNQSALNLKAHFEQIKGNAKKSLVLCSEAYHSYQDSSYDAVHLNNLSVAYETCGKRQLALHAASKAISAMDDPCLFAPNGMASSVPGWAILHNAAICALTARNYKSAYECMALCVRISSEQFQKPRCWLRMAEACIGIHLENQKRERGDAPKKFRSVVGGQENEERILLESTTSTIPSPPSQDEASSPLGCDRDLKFVNRSPLWRALSCLTRAVKTSEECDKECYSSAMCSLAYVNLELQDYQGALDCASSILYEDPPQAPDSGVQGRAHAKRLATMRIYACEACYAVGRLDEAVQMLSAGDMDDPGDLNRLAGELSGTSLESQKTAQANSCLARARCLVQTNASVLRAVTGNLGSGKELAWSALQSAEHASNGTADNALVENTYSARQALLYCMMREGNSVGTLAELRSV